MISDNKLAAITAICVIIVVATAVMRIGASKSASGSSLLTARRSVPVVPIYDPGFYDPTSDDMGDEPVEAVLAPKEQVGGSTGVQQSPARSISARAYIVGNVDTGEVYMERDGRQVLPVASMSKLVTAFVATDLLDHEVQVEISSSSLMAPPDTSNLQIGEIYTLGEIMRPLLLNSSNVAAEAISSSTEDRTAFLEAMSSYAWEIGMPDTYFADPSGVSPRNAATARDLFSLARYLYEYRPDILKITRTASISVATTSSHGAHDFTSTHPFVSDPRFIGGKTGRTPEAGETMMTIMDIDGAPVAIIVLSSIDRQRDTTLILDKLGAVIGRNDE